jgi:ribose 5-phosphate isomerase B
MKVRVLEWVAELGHVVFDLGCVDESAVDYPDFAQAVAEAVTHGRCDLGVVIDGAGIGSAMAANKVPGVRAAMCYDEQTARNAREHNYANVLSIGGRILEPEVVRGIVATFLATPEGAARHGRRVEKITAIERRYAKKAEDGK